MSQHGQGNAGGDEASRHRRDVRYDDPRPLIDPAKVIGGIRRSKRLIAATTIAGALLGVLVALGTPKQYVSTSEILVDPRDIKLVDRELVSSDLAPSTAIAVVENQMRIMTSGRVVNEVVKRLNLDSDPEFNGSAKSFGLRDMIGELRSLLTRRDTAADGRRNRALAVRYLVENLAVSRGGKTFVITVDVTSQNPEKSALIANTLTDVFIDYSSEYLSTTAGRAADELGAKLEELRDSVEDAERKVEAFRSENDLIDARGRLISDDEIIKINDQLATARSRTIELSARAASARALDLNSVVGGSLPEGVSSNLITELRTQYADLVRSADQAAVKFGTKHPERQAIEAQLAGAREQLRSELRRIAASMQIELKRAVELEQKLAARLAALKARQADASDDMVALRELERDSAAKRAVYESYLLRARETGEQRDLNSANIRVISPAEPPLDALAPSRSTIALAGLLSGFLLGIGLAGMRGAATGMFGGSPVGPADPGHQPASPKNDRTGDRTRRRWTKEPGEESTRPETAAEQQPDTSLSMTGQAPPDGPPPWAATAFAQHHPASPYHPVQAAYPPAVAFGGHVYPPVAAPPPPGYGMPVMAPAAQPPYSAAMVPPQQQVPPFTQPQAQTPAPDPVRPNERATDPKPPYDRDGVETLRDDLREVKAAIYDLAERRRRRVA